MRGICKAIAYFIMYACLTVVLQMLLSMGVASIGAAKGIGDKELIMEFVGNNILGMTVVSGILTIIVIYLVFKVRKKQVKYEWKTGKVHIKDVALAAVISFAFSFLFSLFTYDVPMSNSLMISKSVKFYSEKVPMLGFVLMAANLLIIAPIAEEIVFRGIIYTRVEKSTKVIIAIIVSSVLFGVIHFTAGGIQLVIGATLMGLVFSYIFYRFGSLWICIISHAIANLPEFILYNKPELSSGVYWMLIIVFGCLFVAGCYVINKFPKENKL